MSWKVLVIVTLSLFPVLLATSAFDCKGQKAWPVHTHDNDIMMPKFQNMLQAYQQKCSKSRLDYWTTTNYGGGIGAGMMISIVNFMKAFELGKIYRPKTPWLWAAPKPSVNCFNEFASVDCFNTPLSTCWYKGNASFFTNLTTSINTTEAFDFIKKPCDICTLAKKSNKTILWVMGQMLHYHMRLPDFFQRQVDARIETIFPKNLTAEIDPITKLKCMSASLHVRGGTPDFSRRPFDGKDHIHILNQYNKKFKALNSTICKVYVSGDHLEDTIFYPQELKNQTGGNFSAPFTVRNGSFVFMSLPRYIAAPGELEHQVKFIKFQSNITMVSLYSEYVEDLLLHAQSDLFVGSHSNMYAAVSALRKAYHPSAKNDMTCFLDSRRSPPPLECLNTMGAYTFFRDAYAGFNGGSIF